MLDSRQETAVKLLVADKVEEIRVKAASVPEHDVMKVVYQDMLAYWETILKSMIYPLNKERAK